MKELIRRFTSPTPSFFKKLQKFGMLVGGIATVIATAPISLPASIVTIGGYLAVASGTIAAVSQLAVEDGSKSNVDTLKIEDK